MKQREAKSQMNSQVSGEMGIEKWIAVRENSRNENKTRKRGRYADLKDVEGNIHSIYYEI